MQLSRIADDMAGGGVSNQAKLPKYLRLSNAILNLIEAGEMRPGDKLPPECTLAGALPASLGTVQKALGHLKTLGVVVRDHGRGTFVAGALHPESGESIPAEELLHFRFADDDRATPTQAPRGRAFSATTRLISVSGAASTSTTSSMPSASSISGGAAFAVYCVFLWRS